MSVEPHLFLKSGEKVLIRKGPLEGMTGIVAREKNGTRVILTLGLNMRSISVEVDGQDLEAVGCGRLPFGYVPAEDPSHETVLP